MRWSFATENYTFKVLLSLIDRLRNLTWSRFSIHYLSFRFKPYGMSILHKSISYNPNTFPSYSSRFIPNKIPFLAHSNKPTQSLFGSWSTLNKVVNWNAFYKQNHSPQRNSYGVADSSDFLNLDKLTSILKARLLSLIQITLYGSTTLPKKKYKLSWNLVWNFDLVQMDVRKNYVGFWSGSGFKSHNERYVGQL